MRDLIKAQTLRERTCVLYEYGEKTRKIFEKI